MSAGVSLAENEGVYYVDFHISMLGNRYKIETPSKTYNVTVKIKDGKSYCHLEDTELCKSTLVLITKCCLKAFYYNNLNTYVQEHGKCPECKKTLSPDKITIATQQKQIDDLTKKVKEQIEEIVFLKAQKKYWEDLAKKE